MRKNSKNEKVIRAMAIGISAMLMASSPLTALAAEGEGNSSEGNEYKNITVTPEAGVCNQAEAVAKDADKAVEGAEKSAADVKAEVVDKVAAGDVKDAEGKDLSQDILDANAKVEDKTLHHISYGVLHFPDMHRLPEFHTCALALPYHPLPHPDDIS